MTRSPLPPLASLLLLATVSTPPASAQQGPDAVRRDMARLRAENSVLRRELKAIKSIVDGVQAKLAASQEDTSKEPRLKVGVVDLGRVFKGYQRRVTLEEQINQVRREMKARLAASHSALKDLRKTSPTREDELQEHRRRSEELQRKITTIREEMSAVLEARVQAMTVELLQDIEDAVARYGAREGFDLILKADGGAGAEASKEAIFRSQVDAVLWSQPRLDLSEAIVAELNGPRADWFEAGQLARVVYVLESAGVSYVGRRPGKDLVLDCRMATVSLAEAARLRDSLKARAIARHYGQLVNDAVQVVSQPTPQLRFTLRLTNWRGGGAEAFCSLDRLLEADPQGALARGVERIRAQGLQVQGRCGRELHLTIRGKTPRVGMAAVARGELAELGLRKISTHDDAPSGTRVELTLAPLPIPAATQSPQEHSARHFPAEEVKAKAALGENVITWKLSPRNDYVIVTQIVVEVKIGASWRPIATLPPRAVACTHRVEDAKPRRYRVVTRATHDDMSPRVRKFGLTLPADQERKVSAPTAAVQSVPPLTLLPLTRPKAGPDALWFRVYRYDRASRVALPPREFRVEVGGAIGGKLEVQGQALDYRSGAVLLSWIRKGDLVSAVLSWPDGTQTVVRSDDPDPAALFPK